MMNELTTSKQETTLTYESKCIKINKWSTKQSRLYVFVKNEDIRENLQNRRDRPVKEYKRLLTPIFKMLGVEKVRWSQNAGCSCGCSPGFILDRKVYIKNQSFGDDIYVTISGAPKNSGNPREIEIRP